MNSDPSWKDSVERLSSAWIDGDDGGAHSSDPSATPAADEHGAQRYLADLLLMDALLANLSGGAADAREDRIRRVMRALDQSRAAPRPRTRLLRWSPVVAVAASVVIVIVGSWVQLARKSLANDVLVAVNEVSAEAVDRVYAIERVRAESGLRGVPQGRLYLRGRSGFVIACDQAILGRSADEFWVVVPPRQVFVAGDFRWIDARATQDELGLRFMQEVSLESRHIPLVQLASVAELMQHDYSVTLSRSQLGDRPVDILTGRRRSDRDELPTTIRLWSDIDSRIIERAEISWEPDNALILELLPAEPVPRDWYGYEAHCQGEPSVRRIPDRR
jgi:hypothetical protein